MNKKPDCLKPLRLGPEAIAQIRADLEKSQPKTPFVVINYNNKYQVVFAASKFKAECIAETQFNFISPIGVAFETKNDFKKIIAAIPKLPITPLEEIKL